MLDISTLQITRRYEDDTTTSAFDVTDGINSFHVKPFKNNESKVIMEFIGAKVFRAISNKLGTFVTPEITLATHNGALALVSRMFANFHSIQAENKKIKSSVSHRKRNENLESSYPFFFICGEDDRSAGNVGMDYPTSMIDFGRFCFFYGSNVKKIINKFFSIWNDGNMYDPTKYRKMNLNKISDSLRRIDGNLQAEIFNAIDAAIEALNQVEGIDITSINFTFKDVDTNTQSTKTFETLEALKNHIKMQIAFNISQALPALKGEVERRLGMEENFSYLNFCLSAPTTPSTATNSTTALSVISTNTQSPEGEIVKKRRCIASNLFAQGYAEHSSL